MSRRIAILHGDEASVGLRELARAAGDSELVFLLEGVDPKSAFAKAVAQVGELHISNRDRWNEIVTRARVDGVTTFDDRYVADQDQIARVNGLKGATRVDGAWDKFIQRESLNRCGASRVQVRRIDNFDDLARARQDLGVAGILKPRRSSTGRGIALVNEYVSDADAWDFGDAVDASGYIFEQLMDERAQPWLAPFVSVDTASIGAQRHHMAMFDKLPLVGGYLETGDIGPSGQPTSIRESVIAVVDRALDGLGVVDRVTHTEVRFTTSGPQVIEVNGRLGGYVQGLTARVTGHDVCRIALDVAVGADVYSGPTLDDANMAESAAGVLLVPLHTADPAVPRHATRVLRALEAVDAVEVPSPVSRHFRTACAWLGGATPDDVARAIVRAAEALAGDEELRSVVDGQWLSAVSSYPTAGGAYGAS